MPSAFPTSLNRIRMRQVALMLALHERRTLHAAASQLGMTVSAASKMLRELEGAVGQPLFDREGRGLKPNAAGLAVMDTCRTLRNTMRGLAHDLDGLRRGSGEKIVIGSIMVALPDCLCRALLAIKEAYPRLSLEVLIDTSDRLIELLRDGALDLVIGRLPKGEDPSGETYLFRPIGEEDVSIIAAPDHPLVEAARAAPLTFAQLPAYPWILQPPGSPSREVIEQEFIGHHAALPTGFIETSSLLVTSMLLRRGDMLAVAPRSLAVSYEGGGSLAILPYDFAHRLSPWGSITYRDRHATAAQERLLALLHFQGAPG